jgi:tRNA-splicing ligase RtcB
VSAQIGTLGGGNHFIEICLDTQGAVWMMLHSGSRNVGKVLAEHHIEIARSLKHNEALADRDLAVFLAERRCSTPTAAICSGRRSTPCSTAA